MPLTFAILHLANIGDNSSYAFMRNSTLARKTASLPRCWKNIDFKQ
ncbi:hypothetical protein ymoll0001_7360 [Yersinia mollaretii ATCC 43969]|uniref:Uncharacterized protein n=1 Tax=Yersinia mollaretii (strain ATCC 43969 / DSM 18520 / CIP 103324 / CNY 7263 / WAIP 204) TaxID=349967 RepID=A0ABM9Y9F8_YERMW|nr:hypothetical protein ymoll0001_7360 [Yersinia mollaretii ATCC 43969]